MCAMPLIGLTLDSEPPGGYSKLPWYALRENYFAAVRRAGGLPVALPHEPEDAAAYLDRIDGLIIPGGGFDVEPGMFGDLLNQLEFSERTIAQSAQDYEFVLSEIINTQRIGGHLLTLFLHR
ncbi:MAG: gamma-glutamyl-gamma-aminobutyrate hydrolase family protein [Proteobacteria bacterium]|nr:gamma-glutamyl-gamma-aminobutyrate hydrolase family protein [Pseudomonadota bacterium]